MKKKKQSDSSPIHVGELIGEVMYQQHISKHEFADRIATDRSNVYRILKKESVETGQLWRYGKILNYNFFKDLAEWFEESKDS